MKNGKRATRKRRSGKRAEKSSGTVWAEQTRAQCNQLTDAEREKLLDRAVQLAYSAGAEPTVARRR